MIDWNKENGKINIDKFKSDIDKDTDDIWDCITEKEIIDGLKKGYDINKTVFNGKTLLNASIETNTPRSIETAKLLIKYGADVNLTDNDGWGPLWNAVFIGDEDMIKLLIQHHANINIIDKEGDSILFRRTSDAFYEIIEYLINLGVDVNIINKRGHDAFFELLFSNGTRLEDSDQYVFNFIELFVNAGTNLNIRYKEGSVAHVLLKNYVINEKAKIKILKYFIKKGLKLSSEDIISLMILSYQKKMYKITKFILTKIASLNFKKNLIEKLFTTKEMYEILIHFFS